MSRACSASRPRCGFALGAGVAASVMVAGVARADEHEGQTHWLFTDRSGDETNPFRGSAFFLEQSVTTQTAAVGMTPQSYVPLYELWLSFRPRWWFDPHWSVRLRFDYTKELTNDQPTTTYRQDVFGDTWTDGVYFAQMDDVWKKGSTADVGPSRHLADVAGERGPGHLLPHRTEGGHLARLRAARGRLLLAARRPRRGRRGLPADRRQRDHADELRGLRVHPRERRGGLLRERSDLGGDARPRRAAARARGRSLHHAAPWLQDLLRLLQPVARRPGDHDAHRHRDRARYRPVLGGRAAHPDALVSRRLRLPCSSTSSRFRSATTT